MVLPALHGAGDEIMLLLSVSENFGESRTLEQASMSWSPP